MSGAEGDIKVNASRRGLQYLEATIAQLGTHYVVNGAVVPLPANPARLDGTVIFNLPNPSTVTINATPYRVTDGTLDMTFPRPGAYAITVSSPFPYLDASFTVNR